VCQSFHRSKGREPSKKSYLKNGTDGAGNSAEGQLNLPGSVQAKDIQYGEYPKYMLEDSLTNKAGIKSGLRQAEVGNFVVCGEYRA
jgi:hypothetical protein